MRIRIPTPATIIACCRSGRRAQRHGPSGRPDHGRPGRERHALRARPPERHSVPASTSPTARSPTLDVRDHTLRAVDFAPRRARFRRRNPPRASGPCRSRGAAGSRRARRPAGLAGPVRSPDRQRRQRERLDGVQADRPCRARVARSWSAAARASTAPPETLLLDESYPTAPPHGTRTAPRSSRTAVSWHISAYAICANTGS